MKNKRFLIIAIMLTVANFAIAALPSPTVSIKPSDKSTANPIKLKIILTFSEPVFNVMQNICLYEDSLSGEEIKITSIYYLPNNTFECSPSKELKYARKYFIVLNPNSGSCAVRFVTLPRRGNEIVNNAGNYLDQTVSSFATLSDPNSSGTPLLTGTYNQNNL